MTERALLSQLVEAADRVEPDWPDALRRANAIDKRLDDVRERVRPRHAIALAVILLGAVYAVTAVAADQPLRRPVYWLFDRSTKTYPVLQQPTVGEWQVRKRARGDRIQDVVRVPVLDGRVAGLRWEAVVFIDGAGDLNVGLNPGGTPAPYYGTNVPSLFGGGLGSFYVRWMPGGEGADDRVIWWVTGIPGPIADGGGTGPKWLFGPAAPNVMRVDLENNDGRVVRVPTFAGPPGLKAPTRMWVAALPLTHLVHSIVARDAEGTVLERHELPIAQ